METNGTSGVVAKMQQALEIVHNPYATSGDRRTAQDYLEEVKDHDEALTSPPPSRSPPSSDTTLSPYSNMRSDTVGPPTPQNRQKLCGNGS